MKQLEWALSQWHAISASRAPLKINGVLYHDIYSILKTMMEKPEVKTWLTSLEAMFDHLSDYENPHEVTMEQLPTTVIEYLYSLWREQGYQGTLEFFQELLFTYITVIQFDDLFVDDNLYSEELIPSVRAVNLYIKKHNEDLNAHTVILERIFGNGNYHKAYPTYSGFRMYGDCANSKHFDSEKKVYRNIPFLGEIAKVPQEYSVCVGFRFTDTDKDLCSIHSSDDTSNYYTLGCSWSDKTVYLKKNDTRILEFRVDEYIADGYIDMPTFLPVVIMLGIMIVAVVAALVIAAFKPEISALFTKIAVAAIGVGILVVIIVSMVNTYKGGIERSVGEEVQLYVYTAILIAVIAALALVFGKKTPALDTRGIVYAAVCIAMSFALSYVRFLELPQGGSITFASLVPLMVFSYMYGIRKGVLAGIIYGFLQFVQAPWFYHPVQFLLDYPIAFCAIGLAAIFHEVGLFKKSRVLQFALGAAAVSLAILGPDNFILPAMVAICVMLAALRGRLAKEVAG